MSTPIFLGVDEVLAIHADQIERYGGSLGVRDPGLLQSAVAMPAAQFGGQLLHGSIEEMAAAHLFHISQNHPFVDGNKRAALAATIAFLGLNDLALEADDAELLELVLRTAQGRATKAEIAVFIRRNLEPV